jgi:protein MPE1
LFFAGIYFQKEMQVFYRFRSEKKFGKMEMERSSIPLWELRAEISAQRHLTMHDYHTVFYLEDIPITDSYTTIYSNAKIVIERVPMYMKSVYKVEDEAPAAARGSREGEKTLSIGAPSNTKMPPPSYTCFRCDQKGHFIQDCPATMRRRKATGIPKAFLVSVEEEKGAALMSDEGKLVRAQPQTREFSKHFGKQRSEVPPEYMCGKCGEILDSAMSLGCGHKVCACCMEPRCPVCRKRVLPSDVQEDLGVRREIDSFLEKR